MKGCSLLMKFQIDQVAQLLLGFTFKKRWLFNFLFFQMESMMTRKGELPDDLACFLQQQKQRQVFYLKFHLIVFCIRICIFLVASASLLFLF